MGKFVLKKSDITHTVMIYLGPDVVSDQTKSMPKELNVQLNILKYTGVMFWVCVAVVADMLI